MPESPLCAVARARGAACEEIDGSSVAADWGNPAGEYDALRDDVAVVDLAFRERLRITGGDRVEFLQGMLSNDVKALTPGSGCHALALTEQGKMVADCVVLATEDAVWLDAVASALRRAAAALERYIVADDVDLGAPAPPDHAFGLYGPRTVAALRALGVERAPDLDYAHAVVDAGGARVRLVRVPAPGAGGYLCLVAAADALAWWERVTALGIRAAGFHAFDVLRIEDGVPWDGRDLGPDTIALEAPLADAISFSKGCYLGQEIIERVSARGHVNRHLVRLDVAGDVVPAAGDPIVAGEREVGRVTSARWSWRLARPIALGYVRREHVAAGARLAIRGAAPVDAIVHPLGAKGGSDGHPAR